MFKIKIQLMKLPFALLLFLPLLGISQINLLNKIKKDVKNVNTADLKKITSNSYEIDISAGLKEALNKGIEKQVTKLTAKDGFFKNELVKIMMPSELKKVDETLRKFGLGSMADEGLIILNRAAEDAVKESTPIFLEAVKNMSFADAKKILMGSDNEATTYLQTNTTTSLYSKFNPIVKNSFSKVGADKIWAAIIKKYNTLPMVTKVNPDLTDYTTNKALEGVFKMIAVEEKIIRTDLNSRTTTLLQNVFSMQDKK